MINSPTGKTKQVLRKEQRAEGRSILFAEEKAGGIVYPELQALEDQLDAAEQDALSVASDLSEEGGRWRPQMGSWSVSECLDHLANTNRAYLVAMNPAALRAREHGSKRRGPALPGAGGRAFVWSLEPPVKPLLKMRAPRSIRPRDAPSLAEALASFLSSQDEVQAFLRTNEDLNLAGTAFPNPFLPGVRFSLATALHVITAHERRHLWQAWRVRRMAEAR